MNPSQPSTQSSAAYDASRLANFGRDTSRAYAAFLRAQAKLCEEINAAIESGVKPIKVAHDVMGRCATHEARVDLMSVLIALAQMGKIPEGVTEPFEQGIRPRRL